MRFCPIVSATCLFIGSNLPAQAPATATQTLNVSANLVVVPVTVRDRKDHLIRTLNREDFTLEVDGKPQSIRYFDREDDLPLTVGLLVDVSGSQRTVLDAERTASVAFLDSMLKPDRDRAFVVQFGRSADLLADITPSMPKLRTALQKIDGDDERPGFQPPSRNDSQDGTGSDQDGGNPQGTGGRSAGNGGRPGVGPRHSAGGSAGGGTVLYDAVYLSSDEVLKQSSQKNGGTRKALILLTDGDDRGSKESVTDAIEAAQRTDATLYAIYYKGEEGGGFPGIGFPGGGGRERIDGIRILERMADETGGRVYEVTKKMPLDEIYRQIAEELRSQYRIGFSPANTNQGFHRIVVDTAKQSRLILQSRNGYYANGAAN